MSGNKHHPGFWAVVLREMSQIRAHSRYALAMIVLPLVSFALTWGLFSNQYPQDLPIAVIDLDHSALSRTVIKAIDATSVIEVTFQVSDPDQARDLMLRGSIYAMVVLPHGLEKDILRGSGASVIGYTNTQILLPGSIISSSLSAAVATVSCGINYPIQAEARRNGGSRHGSTWNRLILIGMYCSILSSITCIFLQQRSAPRSSRFLS